MSEEKYRKISDWFRNDERRLKAFVFIYKILPCLVVMAYGIIVLYEVFWGTVSDTIRVLLVPAITFFLCTIFRRIINEQRPYESMNIHPLIQKKKKGQSFPSRHMVSAGVIAVAAMYINIVFGVIMIGIGIVIGIIRPIAGVHYVRDVIAGFAMGILCGIIGLFII